MLEIAKVESYQSWRDIANQLLLQKVPPAEICWERNNGQYDLFGNSAKVFKLNPDVEKTICSVPKKFVQLAKLVACYRDSAKWSYLYEALWRICYDGESYFMMNKTDKTLRQLEAMSSSVRRDIHKMRAFVRFREVSRIHPEREAFASWFEPEHLIVEINADFFRKRFAGMDWSILTPDKCVHWNGEILSYSEGVSKDLAPDVDALEQLWKTYYRSIFNPARLKLKMMQSEMPKKYWKNLPEVELIEELTKNSTGLARYTTKNGNEISSLS